MLQGPLGEVAHSKTVPAPQPVAEMEPDVEGQTLFTMLMLGAEGGAFTTMEALAVAEHPLALV